MTRTHDLQIGIKSVGLKLDFSLTISQLIYGRRVISETFILLYTGDLVSVLMLPI